MCIARHERIEGPVDRFGANRAAMIALIGLELLSDLQATGIGMHREHVGPVGEAAVSHAADAKDEAEHLAFVVEGAGRDASHLLGDLEEHWGDFLEKVRAPGELLEGDALTSFGEALEGTNLHGGGAGEGCR